MAIIYVIRIKEAISQNLMSSSQVLSFFEVLSNSIIKNVVIDFSGVVFISSSFAKQYVICKQQSETTKIREINMSNDISIPIESNVQEIRLSSQL